MSQRVLIIGGGLAGLAAASALAARGFQITLLESRNRLGGRAGSFEYSATGRLVDACQHVSMGCCTNFAHFCRTVGIDPYLEVQPRLYFMTPDGRVSRMQSAPWPAPLHLARSFLGLHFFTPMEKLRIAWGLLALKRFTSSQDPPFHDWLMKNHQTPATIANFWGLVLTSALNESPERIGLRYARKVFVDAFLRHPRGFEVELPTVPLGRLYGDELTRWLTTHGVQVQLNSAVKSMTIEDEQVTSLQMRDGSIQQADHYIAAVPFDRLLGLLPEAVVDRHVEFSRLRRLETSPITSLHLWLDRPVLPLPHVVLVGCVGQWVFRRQDELGEYLQVVISAARQFRGLGHDEVQRQVLDELGRLFPKMRQATIRHCRVVTEHSATFSAMPGVDELRPKQTTPIANLFLAGDWTATGWPATMEGAVRSGYLAAEAILNSARAPSSLVQADL